MSDAKTLWEKIETNDHPDIEELKYNPLVSLYRFSILFTEDAEVANKEQAQ